MKRSLFVLALLAMAPGVSAEPFIGEQERLASYCAGYHEARVRELNGYLKLRCESSTSRECKAAAAELDRIQKLDARIWAFLTTQLYTAKDRSELEKAQGRKAFEKGSEDTMTCRTRGPDKRAEDLLACRETQGCTYDGRFPFLAP